jgi:putative peptide zinc metalloprotease protein
MNQTASTTLEPHQVLVPVRNGTGFPEEFSRQTARRYCLSRKVTIFELDTSHSTPRYQLSNGERRFQINQSALHLLEYLRQPRTIAEVEELVESGQLRLDESIQVRRFIQDFLLEKRIIVDCDTGETGTEARAGSEGKSLGLLLSLPLLSQQAILPLTKRLHGLFAPVAAVVSLAFMVLGHALFFAWHHPVKAASLSTLSMAHWIELVLLVYLGVFFHELGHASACLRYGARHGEIGMGIYIIYPVFYCNVTDCWSLPRYRRAVVDLGGVYFQMLFGTLFCFAWWWSGNELFALVVYSTLAGLILNLNPFLKFDGYWLLTDLTGLPSMHRACRDLAKYLYFRLRRKTWVGRRPEVFDTPYRIRFAIVVYALLSGLFTVYITLRIAFVFVPLVIHTYVAGIPMLFDAARQHQFNREILGLMFRLLFLSVSCWGLCRTVVLFTRHAWRWVWARATQ